MTPEQIMLNMGFPDSETGPFVTELRNNIAEQVRRGLRNRSGGTWGEKGYALSHEERARCILEMDWEVANGHCARVDNIDHPTVEDRARSLACDARVFLDRKVLRKRNPYSLPSPIAGRGG